MHWEQILRLKNGQIERLEGSLDQAALCNVYGAQSGSDDSTLDLQRARQAIAQLQQKILRLTEQLRIEQAARDANVAEYLNLASNTNDKQQSCRIKQVFEKKNQKSAATISQLQRKLEHYRRRLREAEHGGDAARQHKSVLHDVQQGLRGVGARVITGLNDGVVNSVRGGLSSVSHATHTVAGAVASKPREIALLLRSRFGSADNISVLKDGDDPNGTSGGNMHSSPRFGSEEDCSSVTSGSAGANSVTGGVGGPPSSKGNTLDKESCLGMEMLKQEVQELREVQARLEENLEELKVLYQRDTLSIQTLQEELRCGERLEEQLNDLTELHQNEILILKQELASMEEKMAYQSYERTRDLQEALEACQARISNMELQQQQQQVVQLEGLENATARALLGKLINVLLTLMAVLLVFVSTVSNCVGPIMTTRTLFLVLLITLVWKNWDALSGHTLRYFHTPS